MKKYLILAVSLFALTACGSNKEATEQSITLESKETTLTSKEKVLESRAKTLESKESELTEQSKTVESKEKALEEREKAVASKESEQNVTEEYVEENNEPVNEQTAEVPHDHDVHTEEEAAEMQRKYEEENPVEEYAELQAGETLQQIAERSGISVDELLKLNGVSADNYSFFAGDMLRIK